MPATKDGTFSSVRPWAGSSSLPSLGIRRSRDAGHCGEAWILSTETSTKQRQQKNKHSGRTPALSLCPPKMPHLDLPPAVSEIQGTAAEHLCRNAKKRISRQRVLTSYMKFREASEWQELDGGVCDPDGALALDYIDMHSSEETVFQEWDTFAKPTTEPPTTGRGKGSTRTSTMLPVMPTLVCASRLCCWAWRRSLCTA